MPGLVGEGAERGSSVSFPVGRDGFRLDADVGVGVDSQSGGVGQVTPLSGWPEGRGMRLGEEEEEEESRRRAGGEEGGETDGGGDNGKSLIIHLFSSLLPSNPQNAQPTDPMAE